MPRKVYKISYDIGNDKIHSKSSLGKPILISYVAHLVITQKPQPLLEGTSNPSTMLDSSCLGESISFRSCYSNGTDVIYIRLRVAFMDH